MTQTHYVQDTTPTSGYDADHLGTLEDSVDITSKEYDEQKAEEIESALAAADHSASPTFEHTLSSDSPESTAQNPAPGEFIEP